MYHITVGKHKTRIKTLTLADAQSMATVFRMRYGDDVVEGEPEFTTTEFARTHKEYKRALRLLTLIKDYHVDFSTLVSK